MRNDYVFTFPGFFCQTDLFRRGDLKSFEGFGKSFGRTREALHVSFTLWDDKADQPDSSVGTFHSSKKVVACVDS